MTNTIINLGEFEIRAINSTDNASIAKVIRSSLEELGAVKPGTVYYDPTTDCLSKVFEHTGSRYFIVTNANEVVGGAGIYPTDELPAHTCELVKLYLSPAARGIGIGKKLMQICEDAALGLGYHNIYLETMPELTVAIPLYIKMGYQLLDKPLGNSGHGGCDIWMLKEIGQEKRLRQV